MGITHILTVASSVGPSPFPEAFKYTIIDVEDRMSVNLAAHFNQAFAAIDEGVKAGGILVHCLAGNTNSLSTFCLCVVTVDVLSAICATVCLRLRLSVFCSRRSCTPLCHRCLPAGMSRSVTIVTAYLMKSKGWDLRYALGHVKAKRPIAQPNLGFLRQLQEYESALQWEEDEQAYRARTMKNALDSWYS